MKKIYSKEIQRCRDCPAYVKQGDYCLGRHVGSPGDTSSIPSWCPLEDAAEKNPKQVVPLAQRDRSMFEEVEYRLSRIETWAKPMPSPNYAIGFQKAQSLIFDIVKQVRKDFGQMGLYGTLDKECLEKEHLVDMVEEKECKCEDQRYFSCRCGTKVAIEDNDLRIQCSKCGIRWNTITGYTDPKKPKDAEPEKAESCESLLEPNVDFTKWMARYEILFGKVTYLERYFASKAFEGGAKLTQNHDRSMVEEIKGYINHQVSDINDRLKNPDFDSQAGRYEGARRFSFELVLAFINSLEKENQ
ncbi:hypothetical protein LCGC14_2477830 [marine sediment metagenome]|uniref:Uncharacterized protein n=1 Tax=marine sediment metagenome TaxID=412755 RepID=A0A0F9BWD2_9ZZZZ